MTTKRVDDMNPTPDSIASKAQPLSCPNCGGQRLSARKEVENFVYGEGKEAAKLHALVEILHCDQCGFEFTDERSSDARHEAVCRYLKVMTPSEIVALRERYELSQTDFAEVSGIGKASLARWETGLIIQNRSSDNLLYLLSEEANIQRLRARHREARKVPVPTQSREGNIVAFKPRFQRIGSAEEPGLRELGRTFKLFSPALASQ